MHCALCGHRSERAVCAACAVAVAKGVVAEPERFLDCWPASSVGVEPDRDLAAASVDADGLASAFGLRVYVDLARDWAAIGRVAEAVQLAARTLLRRQKEPEPMDAATALMFERLAGEQTLPALRERLFPA